MNEMRLLLGLSDFKALVRGEVVDKEAGDQTIRIALSDIGWKVMAEEVAQAAADRERRRKDVSRRRVAAFSPGQATPSFPDGGPQRESYDSDADYFRAEKDYEAQWRHFYQCAGCGDVACPQCGRWRT